MVNRMIYVTFQRKGVHRYPAANFDPRLTDVSYLGNEHRHLFHFKIFISVEHSDRALEFHQFLNWVESLYDSGVLQLDNQSCEMIAENLYVHINERYPNRRVIIDISEDDECGAILEWNES